MVPRSFKRRLDEPKTTSIRIRCTEKTRLMFRKIAIRYRNYEEALLEMIDCYLKLHGSVD